MRSPFAMFRKHQRVLMVVTIGLSLFAFVICSGATDPTNMPKSLMALAIVCMCGGVAWLIGLPNKKSNETAVMGMIIGVALAVVLIRTSGPPAAVLAETGNISRSEFDSLRRQRELANQFVAQAIFRTREEGEYQTVIAEYQFGGLTGNPNSERDIVTTELLRREAEALGLAVPEEAVTDYINEFTDNGMTPDLFKELRQSLNIGEDQLFEVLASELQARVAAEFLYDFDFKSTSRLATTLTPEQYWEFYRQIWVEQSAEVAVIPVKDFVDESLDPPLTDLQQLFLEYRGNYPNQTKTGLLEEGRFGFRQPRKVQVAFLEVVFDEVKETVEAPTAADVDEYYQENYVREAEERAAAEAEAEMQKDDEPVLPELEFDRPEPPDSGVPASEPGDAESPPAESAETPTAESNAVPGEGLPEEGAAPAANPEPSNEEKPDTTDSSESPETAGTRIGLPGGTQFVALQQARPSDAAVENDEASDETPSPEQTPAASDDADATSEASPASGESEGEVSSEPAPPTLSVPPLTEALREQIRTEIVRERTLETMKQIATAAMQAFTDLAYRMSLPDDDGDHITAEELSREIAGYAEDNGLYYGTTPHLTLNDLQESEEYPVGSAFVEGRGTVAVTLEQSNPKDLYRADIAEALGTDSRFVFWKVADIAPTDPDNLDDEGVREQVEEAWREQQARASARNRAEELMVLIRGAEGDMQEALAGQTTTGDADGDALVVVPTGEFRWLSDPRAPRPDPFFSSPQLRDPNGVTNVGPDFMETVFNKLAPGEVGIAANVDRSEYYLVKVLERTPWGEEEEEVFRQEFLAQPIFEEFSGFNLGGFRFSSVYQRLATAEVMRYRHDWVEQLWKKHGAQLLIEAS